VCNLSGKNYQSNSGVVVKTKNEIKTTQKKKEKDTRRKEEWRSEKETGRHGTRGGAPECRSKRRRETNNLGAGGQERVAAKALPPKSGECLVNKWVSVRGTGENK